MTLTKFRGKVILWLLSYKLSLDVLKHPKLKLPLKMKDPVWVWEKVIEFGGPEYKVLNNEKAKMELYTISSGKDRRASPSPSVQ